MDSVKRGNKIIIKALENDKIPLQILQIPSTNSVINLKGSIDRIDIFNDTYRIVDYKTGLVHPTELQCDNLSEIKFKPKLLQLVLYAWLFSRQHPSPCPPIITGVINLRATNFDFQNCLIHKTPIITPSILIDFERELVCIIADILDPTQKLNHISRTEPCRFCD